MCHNLGRGFSPAVGAEMRRRRGSYLGKVLADGLGGDADVVAERAC